MFKKYILGVALGFMCCNTPQSKTSVKFFDVKGYFSREAARLQKQTTKINKKVSHNQKTESKTLEYINWSTELSLFTESDINKPAWENSYRIIKNDKKIEYSALKDDLRTRKIVVLTNTQQKIVSIEIVNKTKNALYNSEETLKYVPDSLVHILKKQQVLISGDNQYEIIDTFY